jgi:hypothetical protein
MMKLLPRIDLRFFARVVFPEQDGPLMSDAAEKVESAYPNKIK